MITDLPPSPSSIPTITVAPGQTLFESQDQEHFAYRVRQGILLISSSERGQPEAIGAIYFPGELYVGFGAERERSGRAPGSGILVVQPVRGDYLAEMVALDPMIYEAIVATRREKETFREAMELAIRTQCGQRRLVSALLWVQCKYLGSGCAADQFDLSIRDLANLTGIEESTVATLLDRFGEQGLVQRCGQGLRLNVSSLLGHLQYLLNRRAKR